MSQPTAPRAARPRQPVRQDSPARPGLARRVIAASIVAAFGAAPGQVLAQLPAGASVASGTAQIVAGNGQMTVTSSPNAVLNWESFSIGAANGVRFEQANAASKVLNRVVGNNPSSILGTLSSNGEVWLVNPHGVLFGSAARIDVGALVASTLGVTNDDFLSGRHRFDAAGAPAGQVLNGGSLATSFGGHVWLVGASVRNEGTIEAVGGQVVLAAGQSIELVDSGMPNVTVRVSAPENETVNLGTLFAPAGGSIDLHGAIVNQEGVVRADSVEAGTAGRVLIRAQGDVRLGSGSEVSASGIVNSYSSGGDLLVESVAGTATVLGSVDATSAQGTGGRVQVRGREVEVGGQGETAIAAWGAAGGGTVQIGKGAANTRVNALIDAGAMDTGDGGRIVVTSDGTTQVSGALLAAGGFNGSRASGGGNGGLIETSGAVLDADAAIDLRGPVAGGAWNASAANITVAGGESTARDADARIDSGMLGAALAQGARVQLKAGRQGTQALAGNIVIAADIDARESDAAGASLALEAQGGITVKQGVAIESNNAGMALSLSADRDGDGAGAIMLDQGARIATGSGNIRLAGGPDAAGWAPGIALRGATLDAGSGAIAIAGRTVEATEGSVLKAHAIAMAGGTIGLTGTDVVTFSTGDAIAIAGGTVALSGTTLFSNGALRVAASGVIGLSGGTTLTSMAAGDAVVLSSATLAAADSRIDTRNGRWLAYLPSIRGTFSAAELDRLGYTFVQMNAGAGAPAVSGVGQHGVIVRANETVTVKVDASRVYDGSTGASFSRALASDAGPEFVIQPSDMMVLAEFSDKHAGADKAIAYPGSEPVFGMVTSTGQWVYGVRQAYVADISRKTVTAANLAAADKVYDATRSATVSGTLSGIVAGDSVSLSGATGLFDDKHVGTGKTVTVSGATLAGADANNYQLGALAGLQASITPRAVAAYVTAQDKVYDGTRNASVSGTLSGILAGDSVSLEGAAGLFDDKHAGAGKTVTVSGAALAGADAKNYQLGALPGVQATITPRAVDANMTAQDKVYDGTRAASVSGTLSGVLAGDSVSLAGASGLFDDKNVGVGKAVTASGAALAGTDANNYVLGALPGVQADITPRAIAANMTVLDKVYDGTRAATVSRTLSGILAGDSVSLEGASGLFEDKHAGVGKTVALAGAMLAGADARNYAVSGADTTTARASITPRPITTDGVTALDKVYDGTRTAQLSGALMDVLPGDAAALDAVAEFDDRNAGIGKTVTITGVLRGSDAANYALSLPANTRAAIAHRPLSILMTGAVRKQYDATTLASLAQDNYLLDGIVAGDSVAVRGPAQGSFDSANVGQAREVRASGMFDIGGEHAANYRVGAIDLTGTSNAVEATVAGKVGTITPATLVYEAAPATYLGGLNIGALGGTVSGFKGADTLTNATSGDMTWQSPATAAAAPGAYPVYGSGLAAPNYVFVQAPGNAAALVLTPGVAASTTPQRVQDSGYQAIGAALAVVMPPMAARSAGGAVIDAVAGTARDGLAAVRGTMEAAIAGAMPGRADETGANAFGPVDIGSMSQSDLEALLVQRREFKRKLFADAIHKLAIDPSLADVRPCATAAEASSGACRITPAQLDLVHAARAREAQDTPAAAGRKARIASVPQIERKIALLVGINQYADKEIPQLVNAIPDVETVGALFAEKFGYDVRVLRNPDKATIIRRLNGLAAEVGSTDSVVVYFAGHGFSPEQNGAGYWLGSDAKTTGLDGWISNSDVATMLSAVRSKQVTLISDSCYSGAFAREGLDAVGRNVTVDDVLARRSVVVLSSGGDEPVPDNGKKGHSIFAWNLLRVLGSVTNWTPGSAVFTEVQARVRKEFPQTPKYGSLTAAGHQPGGDYLFELRSN